jgi:hypothetical protein
MSNILNSSSLIRGLEDRSHFSSSQRLGSFNSVSHTNLSTIVDERGLEGIADSLVDGQIDFIYLKKNPYDPYRYSIVDGIPENMTTDSYITLSKHGLVTYEYENSESIGFTELLEEQKRYNALRGIPIFYNYRKWYD